MYWSRAGSLVAVPYAALLKAAILSMQLCMWECMYYTCLRLVCGKIIIAYEYCHCLLRDSKTVWQAQIKHRLSLGKTMLSGDKLSRLLYHVAIAAHRPVSPDLRRVGDCINCVNCCGLAASIDSEIIFVLLALREAVIFPGTQP